MESPSGSLNFSYMELGLTPKLLAVLTQSCSKLLALTFLVTSPYLIVKNMDTIFSFFTI